MKTKIFMLMIAFLPIISFGQEAVKKINTVTIQTSAECGSCKTRLEEGLNYTKGIKYAELDLETKKIEVRYVTSKISFREVKEAISKIGYDADEVKAIPSAVEKLPACCKPGGMKGK